MDGPLTEKSFVFLNFTIKAGSVHQELQESSFLRYTQRRWTFIWSLEKYCKDEANLGVYTSINLHWIGFQLKLGRKLNWISQYAQMWTWYCEDGGPWQLIERLTVWQYTPESFTSKIWCCKALYLRTTSYCGTFEREFSKPLCCSSDPIKAHMDCEIVNLGLCQEQGTVNFDILNFGEDREFWHLSTSQGFRCGTAASTMEWEK